MKKVLSTILVLTMAASLIACGKSSSDGTNAELPKWDTVLEANSQALTYMTGFDNESYDISVGYSGQIKYTSDGAKTWNDGENSSYCRFGLTILPDGVAYTCGNAGHVTKTTDSGKTWSRMADFGDYEPNQCRILSFINADTGFIAATSRLAYTSDGAKTWNELTLPEDIIGLRFVNDKACYLIGTSGTLYISSDLGQSWNKTAFTLPKDIKIKTTLNSATINVTDDNIEFFCIGDDNTLHIMCSTDNGDTWEEEEHPSVEKKTFLYLSQDGHYLTANDTTGGQYIVIKK